MSIDDHVFINSIYIEVIAILIPLPPPTLSLWKLEAPPLLQISFLPVIIIRINSKGRHRRRVRQAIHPSIRPFNQ